MNPGRHATVIFLGLLGSVIVYSIMMAFGDPLLELAICAGWLPVYLGAHGMSLRAGEAVPAASRS